MCLDMFVYYIQIHSMYSVDLNHEKSKSILKIEKLRKLKVFAKIGRVNIIKKDIFLPKDLMIFFDLQGLSANFMVFKDIWIFILHPILIKSNKFGNK